jgi:hypothetical protein
MGRSLGVLRGRTIVPIFKFDFAYFWLKRFEMCFDGFFKFGFFIRTSGQEEAIVANKSNFIQQGVQEV